MIILLYEHTAIGCSCHHQSLLPEPDTTTVYLPQENRDRSVTCYCPVYRQRFCLSCHLPPKQPEPLHRLVHHFGKMSLSAPTSLTTTTSTMPTTSTQSAPLLTTSVLTTETAVIDTSVFTSCTTVYENYYTTLTATRGETITFSTPTISPSASPSAVPTTKVYPTYEPTITTTTTITELAIYLQSPSATTIYSTWTLPLTSTLPPQVTNLNDPGQLLYVISPAPTGWDSWSDGAKAGLIVGVILGALLLLMLLWCCCKRIRNNEWVAHDWRWARNVEGGPAPGANTVPTVQVSGALDRRLATPYGYGNAGGYGYEYGQQGHPGWGWMRGGGEADDIGRRLLRYIRGWTSKEHIVIDEQSAKDVQSETNREQAGKHGEQYTSLSTATDKPSFYRAPASREESRAALFGGEAV